MTVVVNTLGLTETELKAVFDGYDLDLNCRGQVNLFHGVFFHDLFDVFKMFVIKLIVSLLVDPPTELRW